MEHSFRDVSQTYDQVLICARFELFTKTMTITVLRKEFPKRFNAFLGFLSSWVPVNRTNYGLTTYFYYFWYVRRLINTQWNPIAIFEYTIQTHNKIKMDRIDRIWCIRRYFRTLSYMHVLINSKQNPLYL